jgi:hypothetical protein
MLQHFFLGPFFLDIGIAVAPGMLGLQRGICWPCLRGLRFQSSQFIPACHVICMATYFRVFQHLLNWRFAALSCCRYERSYNFVGRALRMPENANLDEVSQGNSDHQPCCFQMALQRASSQAISARLPCWLELLLHSL